MVVGAGGAAGPLGDAEIAATLKDGVLTVSQFKGGLYGGTISLAGVVDGSRPSLSFDFKGGAWGEPGRRPVLPGNTSYPARHTISTGAIVPLSRLPHDVGELLPDRPHQDVDAERRRPAMGGGAPRP